MKSWKDVVARWVHQAAKALFFLFPVKKNKVLFINFNGKGYGCNPKYIAQEILDQKLPLDLVWLLSDVRSPLPEGIRPVYYYGHLRPYYELATAKVIVTNVKNDIRVYKKKSQYVIQTWHGSYSAKRLEAAAADTLSPKYLRESKANSALTDLFLSNSRVLSDCYRRDFWCRCEIMECGFPRNDILFWPENKAPQAVRQWFHLPADSKLVLYAPTFRDDGSTDAYRLDGSGVLQALESHGGNWYLLIRMHPNVEKAAEIFQYSDRILNATPYPDMQELISAADALITDYSSSVFEMSALEKSVYIYACDIEEYDRMRGLNPEYYDTPYPINKTQAELENTIRNSTPEVLLAAARTFKQVYGGVDDGHASQRVVERICQVTGISNKEANK